jgi:transposase
MRRGFNTLPAQFEKSLAEDPLSGHLFAFLGRRGDFHKIIWWDNHGVFLFAKRLERERFVWPAAKEGKINLTSVQLAIFLEGIDQRIPKHTRRPLKTVWPDTNVKQYGCLWIPIWGVILHRMATLNALDNLLKDPGERVKRVPWRLQWLWKLRPLHPFSYQLRWNALRASRETNGNQPLLTRRW